MSASYRPFYGIPAVMSSYSRFQGLQWIAPIIKRKGVSLQNLFSARQQGFSSVRISSTGRKPWCRCEKSLKLFL